MFEITQVCRLGSDGVELEDLPKGGAFRSIALGSSRCLLFLLWLVHGAACLSFFYLYYILDFSGVLLLVLQLFCIVSIYCGSSGYRRAIGGWLNFEEGKWYWIDRFGCRSALEFNGALLWPNLVVLHLRVVGDAARIIVIFSDAVDADELRRLRVLLRMWV